MHQKVTNSPKIMLCVASGIPGLTSDPSLPLSLLLLTRDNGSKNLFSNFLSARRKEATQRGSARCEERLLLLLILLLLLLLHMSPLAPALSR